MKKKVFLLLSVFVFTITDSATCQSKGNFSNKEGYTKDQLYDRLLGLLVGSAIGDAMGAPVEMWSRDGIQADYGYISSPLPHSREASPERDWAYHLPAGATTDDTRWKALVIKFVVQQQAQARRLDASDFCQLILDEYEKEVKSLNGVKGLQPEPYEAAARRMQWLQEWAQVAKPYAEKNYPAYFDALSHFYGGEMVCAGLLYAPAIGAYFPGKPRESYDVAWELSIFDLGYARDLTALTSALVSVALTRNPTPETFWATLRGIDPYDFFKSRLVGRSSFRLYREAQEIVHQARQYVPRGNDYYIPQNFRGDTITFYQMRKAFDLLDNYNQDMPFHAGEIYVINLTALLFSNLDFQKAMEFVVNFGRDNDTVGAVTGGILGANHGFQKLPADKNQVMEVNKTTLGIDLAALAHELTDAVWSTSDTKK